MAPGLKAISYRILTTYEKSFEKIGFFVARKPWSVLLLSVLSLFAACLGFIRFTIKQPSSNDFTATASQSRVDFHHAAQFFPLLEARQEQIVMTPKHNEDILSEDCLKDALLLHQTIVKIRDYEKLCFREPTRTNIMENPSTEGCTVTSPLELAGANFEHLSNLSSILAHEWTNSTMVLSTGQSFRASFEQMLSGFKVKNKTPPLTATAGALRIIYFLRKATNEEDREILDFEASFERAALSVQRHLQCASLFFKTGKASHDALKSILQPEIRPLYLSALTITSVALIVIYFSSTTPNCFTTVSLMLVSVLLPLICAAGIVSMVNTSLGPVRLVIPFLLMGKMTSDIVIFLQEWEHQKVVPSLEHRVSSCVARAGIPLLLTAICGAVVLGMAIRSSFAVISQFFLAGLVTYVIVSIASFTIPGSLLFCLERRVIKRKKTFWTQLFFRRSSFCNTGALREFCERITWMLLSVGGKYFSFFMVACIVTASVLSIFQPGETMGTTSNFYRKNYNFKQFSEAQKTFFGSETDVSIVFLERANYSKPAVQDRVIKICQSLQNAPFSQKESDCWMADLFKWAKRHNMSCSNLKFYRCLKPFLNQFERAHFHQDVRLKDDHAPYQILASRIHVKMSLQHRFKEDRRSLEKLRLALPKLSPLKAAPVSETFFELDDLFSLQRETFFIFLASTVVVFVVSLFSSASLWISTCITGSFILLVLEAAGLMKAWGTHLNHITFNTIVLAIVMALNFSLQVVHSYTFSGKASAEQRMVEALFSVGWSVFTSALLEASGSVSLGFIFPSLQDLFFRLIPPIFALGLIHALVILPPIIPFFVKCLECLKKENELDVPDTKKESILLDVQHSDVLQSTSKHPGLSIVGIGCRFPGANSKDLFWKLLEEGKSSIRAFPQNREDQHEKFLQLYHPKRFVSGRLCAIKGSYMEEIKHFDNRFFGISNLEARGMDPQQRILLEVVYEAIEDAGMRLEDLQRCKTGVFVGVMNLEFGALLTEPSNYRNIDQFSSTGMTASILANRLSFCFNLTGPSIAVDTACSSSLTALKLACDSLHKEDCDIAIVCAPNVVLNHAMQIASSMAGLLAPDGRCKSFDASGDGYGRGEGFAAVILKLSHAALSDKDDVYCEIIACGMNNDGQNAVPMTAPCAKTQAELSRSVLVQSGVPAEDVDYFEAHGTGTAIGDVVEVTSIADTYTKGSTNPSRKLRIGSVKSNLNHTESTSGLAGLIKVALMIKMKRFVPTINVNVINPKLKLEERGMVLQQTYEPWIPENGKLRTGAVNSFGYGGSNVHVILREVASSKQSLEADNFQHVNHVLTMSAHSQKSLKGMAENYSKWLNDNIQDMDVTHVEDLCHSLNQRRSQFPHRLSVSFTSISEASKSLRDYADDSIGWEKDVCYGEVKSADPKVVFMFGGQGSQWYAMGRQLIASEPVFKEAILTVSNLVQHLGETWSLLEELMASDETSRISENSIAQPATFAVQYATAQLLKSWKIHPSAVIGHSLGEFAAACVAGIITLREAVQLVLIRSALQDHCPSNGGMAALGMSEEEARTLLLHLKLSLTLDIAAVNDATSVTVSGDSKSVEALGQHLAMHSKHTFWRVLGTKRAFHSPHMEVIKKPFEEAIKRVSLKPKLSKIPMYSTVKGEVISGEQFNRDYWWQNIRYPVQFQPALKNLLKDGYKQIIEISTQPILSHYVKQIALQEKLEAKAVPVVLATLPRKRVPVCEQHKSFLLTTVCKLYTLGFPIDWACVQRNPSAKFVRSLNYPWLENSFWFRERSPQRIISPLSAEKSTKKKHPFLGKVKMTDLYSGLHCWETEIDLHRFPNLKDHALMQGGTVMPGAVYLEMAFAMAKDQFAGVAGLELSDVKLLSLLTLPDTQVRSLRLRLLKTGSLNKAHFDITSVQDDQSEVKLASGDVCVDVLLQKKIFVKQDSNTVGPAIHQLLTKMRKTSLERFKETTERYGFKYGPTFSIIREIWECNHEGICLVDITESLTIVSEAGHYVIHPSILDACLQSCFIPLGDSLTDDKSIVPVGFKTITLNDVPSSNHLYCHVIADVTEFGRFDVTLMSPSGKVLLKMTGFCVAELTNSPRGLPFNEIAYEVQWRKEELQGQSKNSPHLTCIVLKDSSHFSNNLVRKLAAADCSIIPINLPIAGCLGTQTEETIRSVFARLSLSNSSNLRIINLWPTETSLLPDNVDVIEQAQRLAFSSSVILLKLLMEKELTEARLFLITESTQLLKACGEYPKKRPIPWGSTVWGLRRTANLEGPDLNVTAVDLCNKEDQCEVDFLITEVLSDIIEEEVAYRDGKRFINRLVRSETRQEKSALTTDRNFMEKKRSLYLSAIPSSQMLCLREQSFSKPSHSEVTIDVFYFWTPLDSLSSLTQPNACVFISGRVTDLPETRDHTLQMGDEVCGFISSGRVGSSVTIEVSNAFAKPGGLTREQAAHIPACLALASYALQRASSDEENQTFLIHHADHGPGPAAVLLAKTVGHQVFCTTSDACKTSKKAFLLEMGAQCVMDQSSPVSNVYQNDQFDAVIFFSAPSPNAFQKSVHCLKKGGKIIILTSEVDGDIVVSANWNFKYERENISDLLRCSQRYEKLSVQSLRLLESKGVLKNLLEMELECVELTALIKCANESSPRHEVENCLDISYYVQSLATFEDNSHLERIPLLPVGLDECGLKENRTYLVAGGMGGLGFEVVCWMAENGAKTIGILSRSKPSDDKRRELRQIEKRTGTKLLTFQVDLSNHEQMLSFKDQLQSLPSVAGIVHSAMVLRDEFIKDLTFESFKVVMGPKIKGSFLLHQLSLKMDLDFFVMFSSMASVLGNMGQSSYSACNAFQDSLAEFRRHVLGLPALAINWGPISGAGVMEREPAVAKLLRIAGLGFINAKDGVKHIAKVLTEEPTRCQVSLFSADWPRFLYSNPGLRKTARLSIISATVDTTDRRTRSTESLAQRIILEKDRERRRELISQYVGLAATEWTGIASPSETDLNKSLYSYGVDSTGALTMKMQLEANLGVSFEVYYFMQPDTTSIKLAKDIDARLSSQHAAQPSSREPGDSSSQETESTNTDSSSLGPSLDDTPGSQIEVVPLYNPEGAAIKFFCIHPSHRYALSLVPISTGFQGQDTVSFYALGFTDPTVLSEDWGGVRELAAQYVELITREQRHGPYFLGGYSYGGLLAYEIASLLTEKKQKVEFVAMIDTFPWLPRSRVISTRLASLEANDNSQRRHVELQFENYLKKLAVDSLKITADDYQLLREEHSQDWIIAELQRRSLEKGLYSYNLQALKESLLRDHSVASRTHNEWHPSEVRYRGPLTFLKSRNPRFSPKPVSSDSAEEIWSQLVDGGTTVLVCPGDHYSMSEMPHAPATGSILATALVFSYRGLFPEFPRPTRTFSQRRAVEKLCKGVKVFLHSKKGKKRPHFGKLHFEEGGCNLELQTETDEGETNKEKGKTKKIIHLTDLRMVQPGRYVSSALKFAGCKRRVGVHRSGNLRQVASVITGRRVYNLEFTDYSDLKAFYNMIEAVFGATLLSS